MFHVIESGVSDEFRRTKTSCGFDRPRKEELIWTKLRAFDWFGFFLFVAAITSCLIPITWVSISFAFQRIILTSTGRCNVRLVFMANSCPTHSRCLRHHRLYHILRLHFNRTAYTGSPLQHPYRNRRLHWDLSGPRPYIVPFPLWLSADLGSQILGGFLSL